MNTQKVSKNMYQMYTAEFSKMFIRCLLYENKH